MSWHRLKAFAAGALTVCSGRVWSVDASDYLLLPTVVQAEREIDLRTGFGSSGPTTNSRSDWSLGFGYGVTAHWFTELAAHFEQKQGSSFAYKDLAWENILQLAEPGQWPIDLGLVFEAERSSKSNDQLELTAGALLQKEHGRTQVNFNVLISHVVAGTDPASTRLHLQWQLKYRYSEPIEFGIQGFDNLSSNRSTWAPYEEQVHRFGPAVLGRFEFAHGRSLSYNGALLFGTTDHSPDRTLRVQLEYEF